MSGHTTASRFTTQNQTTSDRLSNNTVGLVALSDFRKRRAEVLEQQEREAREAAVIGGGSVGTAGIAGTAGTAGTAGGDASDQQQSSGSETPRSGDGGETAKKTKTAVGSQVGWEQQDKSVKRTKAKKGKKGVKKLSFMDEEEEEVGEEEREERVDKDGKDGKDGKDDKDGKVAAERSHSLSPAPSSVPPLKSFTKQALRRQAAEREALRKQFLQLQAAVKASDVAVPFVFYEGTDIPGGVVRVKKGDFVWLLLDRSRKVGARLGIGEKKPSKTRQHWARIGVDDLMLVRGNLILPHHYDLYYFIINKTMGPGGVRVFDYSTEAPKNTNGTLPLAVPPATAAATSTSDGPAETDGDEGGDGNDNGSPSDYGMLEGASDDPSLTKVVDRRWYERNKHIYPANVWQEFDPEEDYTQQVRRDQGGNAYFFTGSETKK